MSIQMTVVQWDNSVKCCYPRASFQTIFEMADSPNKWEDAATLSSWLKGHDYSLLKREIDSALNNLENLDLA